MKMNMEINYENELSGNNGNGLSMEMAKCGK
jgi:hypothetical protein